MKKSIIAAVVAAMVSAPAWAQNAILENEYVRAGVNATTGTFGSGGNTSPGLLYDNTGSSTFNTGYDYLTPGTPFDGFSIKIDGSNYNNNNAGNVANIAGGWTSGTTTSSSSADWTGTLNHSGSTWTVRNQYSLLPLQPYVDITTTITAGSAATELWFGRYIDPDARAAAGDSSATDNVIGYGVIPSTNIVFSEALSSRYALGIYSTDTNVAAGISNWTQEADGYQDSKYGDNFGQGDDTIGMSWFFSGVSTGDILTVNYAYIFGPNAFTAADTAIDGGAGGGDTTTTDSWGTLEDVGSATDSASGSSTPVITTETVVNTSLPVLTASITHHDVSDDGSVQTIDRETTTTTTTPMVTNTYTDGVLTSSVAAPSDINSVVTNPGSGFGRIDQDRQLANLNDQLDRSLNFDSFRKDGAVRDDVAVYVNGTYIDSNISNGYSAKSNVYGLAAEKRINNDWRLGIQGNRVITDMNGIDSTTEQNKNHIGVYSVYDLEGFRFVNNLGHAMNSGSTDRTIQGIDFSNSHDIKGTNTWLNNRVYAPDMEGFRPFAGVTFGRSSVDGYTESGSIQSARTVAGVTDNYTYGEAGVRVDKNIDQFRISGEGSVTTDSIITGAVSLGYAPNENSLISVGVVYQDSSTVSSTALTLRGIVRF